MIGTHADGPLSFQSSPANGLGGRTASSMIGFAVAIGILDWTPAPGRRRATFVTPTFDSSRRNAGRAASRSHRRASTPGAGSSASCSSS